MVLTTLLNSIINLQAHMYNVHVLMVLTTLLNNIINLQVHMYNVHVHVLMVLTTLLNSIVNLQVHMYNVHFHNYNLVVIIILNNLQLMSSVHLYVHVCTCTFKVSRLSDYYDAFYIIVYIRSCKLTSRFLIHFQACAKLDCLPLRILLELINNDLMLLLTKYP